MTRRLTPGMASKAVDDAGDDELATAVGEYVLGERSLAGAAESIGLSRWEFEEVLREAGFTRLYGPETEEELEEEIDTSLEPE